jgi:transcriptional regulator with XRE-family HTH domain
MVEYAQVPSPNLTRYRILAGLTQRGLAELAGVSSNSVWQAEHGRDGYPRSVPLVSTQERIAEALSSKLERPVSRFDLWPLKRREQAEEAV